MTNHQVPDGDLARHTPSIHCICVPKIQWHGEGMLVIHQSWNKRETTEDYTDELHRLIEEK